MFNDLPVKGECRESNPSKGTPCHSQDGPAVNRLKDGTGDWALSSEQIAGGSQPLFHVDPVGRVVAVARIADGPGEFGL